MSNTNQQFRGNYRMVPPGQYGDASRHIAPLHLNAQSQHQHIPQHPACFYPRNVVYYQPPMQANQGCPFPPPSMHFQQNTHNAQLHFVHGKPIIKLPNPQGPPSEVQFPQAVVSLPMHARVPTCNPLIPLPPRLKRLEDMYSHMPKKPDNEHQIESKHLASQHSDGVISPTDQVNTSIDESRADQTQTQSPKQDKKTETSSDDKLWLEVDAEFLFNFKSALKESGTFITNRAEGASQKVDESIGFESQASQNLSQCQARKESIRHGAVVHKQFKKRTSPYAAVGQSSVLKKSSKSGKRKREPNHSDVTVKPDIETDTGQSELNKLEHEDILPASAGIQDGKEDTSRSKDITDNICKLVNKGQSPNDESFEEEIKDHEFMSGHVDLDYSEDSDCDIKKDEDHVAEVTDCLNDMASSAHSVTQDTDKVDKPEINTNLLGVHELVAAFVKEALSKAVLSLSTAKASTPDIKSNVKDNDSETKDLSEKAMEKKVKEDEGNDGQNSKRKPEISYHKAKTDDTGTLIDSYNTEAAHKEKKSDHYADKVGDLHHGPETVPAVDGENMTNNCSCDEEPIEARPRLYSWDYSDKPAVNRSGPDEEWVIEGESVTDATRPKKTQTFSKKKDDDIAKINFKQRASKCGISFKSPEKDDIDTTDQDDQQTPKTTSVEQTRRKRFGRNLGDEMNVPSSQSEEWEPILIKPDKVNSKSQLSRNWSEDSGSDVCSLKGYHSDPVDAFKVKASRRGIRIVDPNDSFDLTSESDHDSDFGSTKHAITYMLGGMKGSRSSASQPKSAVCLNPEVPEFKAKAGNKPKIEKLTSSEKHDLRNCHPFLNAEAPIFEVRQKRSVSKKNTSKACTLPGITMSGVRHEETREVSRNLEVCDTRAGVRHVKTREISTNTELCNTRDVAVSTNRETVVDRFIPVGSKGKFVSKSTITEEIVKCSVGVNTNKEVTVKHANLKDASMMVHTTDGIEDMDRVYLANKVKALQVELMTLKEKEIINKLNKQKEMLKKHSDELLPCFDTNRDELEKFKSLIKNKLSVIDKAMGQIQEETKKVVLQINSGKLGTMLDQLPDLNQVLEPSGNLQPAHWSTSRSPSSLSPSQANSLYHELEKCEKINLISSPTFNEGTALNIKPNHHLNCDGMTSSQKDQESQEVMASPTQNSNTSPLRPVVVPDSLQEGKASTSNELSDRKHPCDTEKETTCLVNVNKEHCKQNKDVSPTVKELISQKMKETYSMEETKDQSKVAESAVDEPKPALKFVDSIDSDEGIDQRRPVKIEGKDPNVYITSSSHAMAKDEDQNWKKGPNNMKEHPSKVIQDVVEGIDQRHTDKIEGKHPNEYNTSSSQAMAKDEHPTGPNDMKEDPNNVLQDIDDDKVLFIDISNHNEKVGSMNELEESTEDESGDEDYASCDSDHGVRSEEEQGTNGSMNDNKESNKVAEISSEQESALQKDSNKAAVVKGLSATTHQATASLSTGYIELYNDCINGDVAQTLSTNLSNIKDDVVEEQLTQLVDKTADMNIKNLDPVVQDHTSRGPVGGHLDSSKENDAVVNFSDDSSEMLRKNSIIAARSKQSSDQDITTLLLLQKDSIKDNPKGDQSLPPQGNQAKESSITCKENKSEPSASENSDLKTEVPVSDIKPNTTSPMDSSIAMQYIGIGNTMGMPPTMNMVPGMGPPPAGPGMLPPGDDFDPLLFQAVMGQLIQAYPEMIGDRVMLTNVAMQQTYLLHMYMKGQCQGEGQEAPVTVPGLMNLQGAGMSSDSNIFLGSDVSQSVESKVFSSFHPPISPSPVMSAPVLSTSPSSVPSSKVDTVKDENTTKGNNSVNKNSEILTKGKIVSTKDGNNLADKNHEVSSNKFIEKSNSDCSGSRASLERKPPGIYHPTAKSNDNGFNAGKNSGLSKVCPKPAKDKIVSPTQQNEVSASKITYMDGTKSGEIQENITEMENIKATTDGPRDFMRKSQMDSARPGQMDFLPDFAKKHSPCNMNTKVVEKLVNRLDDQVIRSIDNSDSVHFVRKPLSSASSAEPSRVFSLQSGEFPTLKDSDKDSGKAGQNSRPMKYVPPGLAKRKPDGIVEAQLQMPTKRPSKPTCLFQNGEDWEGGVDEFPETFRLRIDPHAKLKMKRKTDIVPDVKQKAPVPGLSLEKVSKPVSKEISGKGISDISNIPAPKTTNKETLEKADLLTADEKENTDEWCEVKSRKRYKSPEMPVKKASQSRPQMKPLTRNRPIMTNFEKLISRLREEFPGSSRQTLIEAVIKIRTQRGSLSGMTMEKIVESAHPFITKQKKFIPGLSLPPRSSASNNVLNIPKFTKPGEYNNTFTARPVNQGAAAPKSALNCPWTAKSSTLNNTSMTKLVRQSKAAQKTVVNLPKDVPPPKVNKPVIVDFKEDICAICHDDLSMMEVKELDCHHVYHYKCISQWVERERTCPTCRKHALFPEDFPRLGK